MKKATLEIGIPQDIHGKFGLGAGSAMPGTVPKDVLEAMSIAGGKVVALAELISQIREIVKDVYGDGYDAVPTNTCDAALRVAFDALATPPTQGRGDNYRACYITPYERHMHYHGSYGRPFPPKYKDLYADRGSTPGEFGIYGKRLNNLDTVIVPLAGAKYEVHGIYYHVVPILKDVDPKRSIERIETVAERHSSRLSAFTSLGYDTIGYGYGVKDENGVPKLQKYIGDLANKFDIPYICDNAAGLPFAGTAPHQINADVMTYSMDKVGGASTSGLIIGREDLMISIQKSLGMYGSSGTASYGGAAYSANDPGKEALAGQVVALKKLRDNPDRITRVRDDLYKIVKEEITMVDDGVRDGIIISKSNNSVYIEVNYVKTWETKRFGIPIFSVEDTYRRTNLIQEGMIQMGIMPPQCYDGNIVVFPNQGITDVDGKLINERARIAVRGLVRAIEIISKYAGRM